MVTVELEDGSRDVKLGQRFRSRWWCSGCNPGAKVIAYQEKPEPHKGR